MAKEELKSTSFSGSGLPAGAKKSRLEENDDGIAAEAHRHRDIAGSLLAGAQSLAG